MEDVSVLIGKSQAGDKAARDILIENNLGLVHHIVKRFTHRGYEAEDLFQIGTIGLMKAIDNFNLEFDVKFSTYAVPMIMGEIKRFLRDDGMIKISRSLKENAMRATRAMEILRSRLGREPLLSEVALEAGLSAEEISMALEASAEVESIYKAVTQPDGSEVYLVDKVACQAGSFQVIAGGLSDDFEKEQVINHLLLGQLLSVLAEKERMLIQLRYFQDKTQSEIADILGISQVQVSRMEKKILLRMREEIS